MAPGFSTAPGKSLRQTVEVVGENFLTSRQLAAREWSILDFSNDLLPDEFLVRFTDAGSGWGEWSAIATRQL